jgi:hypothetical protein
LLNQKITDYVEYSADGEDMFGYLFGKQILRKIIDWKSIQIQLLTQQ